MFELKREDITEECRKFYNEDHSDLYCLPNIIRVIKSGRMGWVGHAACMGRREMRTGFCRGNLKQRYNLKHIRNGVRERVISKGISKE